MNQKINKPELAYSGMHQEIERILIEIGIDIAKKGEGALFVISDNCQYDRLLQQKFETFNVNDPGAKKLLLAFGIIDGAVIISSSGLVLEYAAMIKKNTKSFVMNGLGTRHQAAVSASSYPNSIAILVSQEERNVKVFKDGKVIVKFNALEQNIKKEVGETSTLLEGLGFGTFGSLASSALVATGITSFGVALAPGIMLFGVPYYLIRRLQKNGWSLQ